MEEYKETLSQDPDAFIRDLEQSIIDQGRSTTKSSKKVGWESIQAVNDKLVDMGYKDVKPMSYDHIARELEYDQGTDESVRIQEARIYKTIQELKVLEKGQ